MDWSVRMNVETTRFGTVEVDEQRIINIPAGLLGFSSYQRYTMLQPDEEGVFFWFQSLDSPELAFVVTDPSLWVTDYQATIRPEQMQELGLESLDDAQIMVMDRETSTGQGRPRLIGRSQPHAGALTSARPDDHDR